MGKDKVKGGKRRRDERSPDAGRHYLKALKHIATGSTAKLERLLRKHPEAVGAQGAGGNTPLHDACRAGSLAAARALLSRGAKLCARDAAGNTPLHVAALHGHIKLVGSMLQASAAAAGPCPACALRAQPPPVCARALLSTLNRPTPPHPLPRLLPRAARPPGGRGHSQRRGPHRLRAGGRSDGAAAGRRDGRGAAAARRGRRRRRRGAGQPRRLHRRGRRGRLC
jgi:ankyrin repeat protein